MYPLDMDGDVKALTGRLQVLAVCIFLVQPPLKGLFHAHTSRLFKPCCPRRRYCHLPVSGRRMQQFLQLRLGCHGLPVATGCLAGAGHVNRANRVFLACNSHCFIKAPSYKHCGAIRDEMHIDFECTALAPWRQQHADLFMPRLTPCALFSLSRTIWGF